MQTTLTTTQRTYLSAIIVFGSIAISIIIWIKYNPLSAITLIASGMYCGAGFIVGFREAFSNPLFKTISSIIAAIGIVSTIIYNESFDTDLSDARSSALSSFISIPIYCKPVPVNLQKISEFGMKACAIKDNANQMSALAELWKGLYLGPGLSIVDAAISASNSQPKDYCALAYKAASDICPSAFLSMTEMQRSNLIKSLQ